MNEAKLKKLSQKYPNSWVALEEKTQEVVGVGKTPKEAFAKSQKRGIKEPIITKIPRDYASYVLVKI